MPRTGKLTSYAYNCCLNACVLWVCGFLGFIAIIPKHLLCQMWANQTGVEFLGSISRLRKEINFVVAVASLYIRVPNVSFKRRKSDVIWRFDVSRVSWTRMLDGKPNGCSRWFLSLRGVGSGLEKPLPSHRTIPHQWNEVICLDREIFADVSVYILFISIRVDPYRIHKLAISELCLAFNRTNLCFCFFFPKITRLKINTNPFATAFRKNGVHGQAKR